MEETEASAIELFAAEHVAEEEAANTAAALVRAAHAGAWIAQHLSVYSRWAKRVASWAGKPPPPPPTTRPGTPRAESVETTERERAARKAWDETGGGGGRETAAESLRAADETYTRAIHGVVCAWSSYISAAAAAAPGGEGGEDAESGSDSSEDEDGGRTRSGGRRRHDFVERARTFHARRSFLRSLWTQAFIAQYCVQGAFTAMHTARISRSFTEHDFQELMRAVKRVVAVATTVESQLQRMGAGEKYVERDGARGGVFTRESTPFPENRGGGGSLSRQSSVDAAAALGVFWSPQRAAAAATASPPREAPPPRAALPPPPPQPQPSNDDAVASMDFIDALWQSVSQVKTLKYEKAIKIGRGGFSTVLRASWRGSVVAVKVLDPKKINGDVVDAIRHEVTVMTANRHPHIVTVLAACVQLPDAAIIMEHCANGSLADVLAKARGKPTSLCWRVRLLMASDAACGLAYLHSSNNQIAHRDLNTQNLLVTGDMRVKIADFGLSRLVRGTRANRDDDDDDDDDDVGDAARRKDEKDADARTREAMRDGLRNCLFHAPEVIASADATVTTVTTATTEETEYDFGTRADVFSFGVVLWCLATLEPPWESIQRAHDDAPSETIRFLGVMRDVASRVARGERLPLPGVPGVPGATGAIGASSSSSFEFESTGDGSARLGPSWTPAFAGERALAALVARCFRGDPATRPTMTKTLAALRKLRREETEREFAEAPPPEAWKGFMPAGMPGMRHLRIDGAAAAAEGGVGEKKPGGGGGGGGGGASGTGAFTTRELRRVALGASAVGLVLGIGVARALGRRR